MDMTSCNLEFWQSETMSRGLHLGKICAFGIPEMGGLDVKTSTRYLTTPNSLHTGSDTIPSCGDVLFVL